MSLKRCRLPNGKYGFKWGEKGRVYVQKINALKQGIEENYFGDEFHEKLLESNVTVTVEEVEQAIAKFDKENSEFGNKFLDSTAKYISKKTREKMPKKEFGWPEEEKYPASTEQEFKAAVHLIGKAPPGKQAMIKKNLMRIAKKNGWAIPETWSK